ncbi:hypothetical protein, partial [Salmonella sp. s55004]|uniref:hypothetical protein n=1 Tax=Salmonella sp. s55004 TaxID=3159675 RepID=UPI00397F3651
SDVMAGQKIKIAVKRRARQGLRKGVRAGVKRIQQDHGTPPKDDEEDRSEESTKESYIAKENIRIWHFKTICQTTYWLFGHF